MWQNKKIHLSQANSKPIISPWSVPIRGGMLAFWLDLLCTKSCWLLLGALWPSRALAIDYILNCLVFILGFLCLMWTWSCFWTKQTNELKTDLGFTLFLPSIFFFLLRLKKHTHIHYSVGQKKKNPKSICWLPKWTESIIFLLYSLWEVLSTDDLLLAKFDWWPLLTLHALLFLLLAGPEETFQGSFFHCG